MLLQIWRKMVRPARCSAVCCFWQRLRGTPAGQIYTFVDSRGVTHFSNVPNDPRYVAIPRPQRRSGAEPARAPNTWVTTA